MAFSRFLLYFIIAFTFFTSLLSGATLPKDEVATLRQIARKLGKTNWNFSVDPCSGLSGWANLSQPHATLDAVTCDCTFSNNTVCHVVGIALKSQNLPGILPPELANLRYIQVIDLDRNFLSGTIPPEWGSTKLLNISLLANRLTGSIPKELGNISTLSSITVEYNKLSGRLPSELGNWRSIQRLLLSSNYFTGELPASFAKLTTLKDFRIPDNLFTGKIPNFIQNWTNLERLVIQGSGLSGPIPSSIAQLENMTDLRISDIKGIGAPFPPISKMKKLTTLILRSCNIIGELPDYLSELTTLKVLDVSFNNLTGGIPGSYSDLFNADYIYLTGNSLSGTIPDWMASKAGNIDLSYNNFTPKSNVSNCQRQGIGIVACLRSLQCNKKWYSFHINCGGREFNDGNTIYEDDTDAAGPAKFYQRDGTNWAFSSTGHFLDGTSPYIWRNTSQLSKGTSQLYTDARLSPLSLTYYGFCLGNGNYTVDLHFAEIMFTNDRTYKSLGRRMFNVYIQGELVLKDFNIAAVAGGVGKGIVKSIPAFVDSNTLEVRFQWAGKGTNAVPVKGVYGSLVSAISVKPSNLVLR